MDDFHRKTDEVFVCVSPPDEQNQPDSQETVTFIDVHIFDNVPLDDLENDQDPLIVDQDSQEDTESVQPRPNTRSILLLLSGILCLLLICALIINFVLPWFTSPPVNITIIPVSKRFDFTQSITVASRTLPEITMSQQKTVATSGFGHTDARAAHGYITFYNSALYPQTIPAGTLLTGSDGVQVVTDQSAYIPAGNLSTNGQVTVLAHSVTPGPQGNIAGGDIYGPCCRQNIMVANAAFSGGQIARNFRTVSQQDITTAVNDLKTSLIQSAQAAFQAQVSSDDTLLPLSCNLSSKPDHAVGAETNEVIITVSTSCSGFTYNSQALQDRLNQIASQEATKQFGSGYSLSGTISSNVIQATPKGNSIVLQVRITANYSYHFTDQEQRNMLNSIAGKSRSEAINVLLAYAGVESVSISSPTLPKDTKNIRLLEIYEQ